VDVQTNDPILSSISRKYGMTMPAWENYLWLKCSKLISFAALVRFIVALFMVFSLDASQSVRADGPTSDPSPSSDEPEIYEMAQFELPTPGGAGASPTETLPKRLTYEYNIGTESDLFFRREPDLDRRVEDDSMVLTPEIQGFITYRPTDWFETTTELILEREIAIREKRELILPDGTLQTAQSSSLALLVDQAFIRLKKFTDPLEFTVGRLNFEDDRHWLYDTSLDVIVASLRNSTVRVEATVGRERLVDLDLLGREQKDQFNTYMLYAEYRGIEDIKFAAYTVYRDDRKSIEGRPHLIGIRSVGSPTVNFSYWGDLAYLRGKDEEFRGTSAYAVDVGATYRFLGFPLNPNVTLGFAFATGDRNPDDNRSQEFRQTGFQSNEARIGGIAEFKYYGEALDPELSNLRILTAGIGFRPTVDLSVDLFYHHYRLDEFADQLRDSGITALMNQVEGQRSKSVGSGVDVVVGLRNLFGVRRLGMDVRAGWFFPGKAFLTDDSTDTNTVFRDADRGVSVSFKLWY
jgi:alginate production protein